MNSQTSLVARNLRLQEWANMIRECNLRPMGMTVNQWCEQHSITRCDFYYRKRAVQKACLDALPTEIPKQAIVPVPAEVMNFSSSDEPEDTIKTSTSTLSLHAKGITIDVKTE